MGTFQIKPFAFRGSVNCDFLGPDDFVEGLKMLQVQKPILDLILTAQQRQLIPGAKNVIFRINLRTFDM